LKTINPYIFFLLFGTLLVVGACSLLRIYFGVAALHASIISINLTALVLMGLDKSSARSVAGRVPETILYLTALIGGAPGLLFGCYVFKHKTRKASFQLTLLLIFCAQFYLLQVLGIRLRD
jgi:uncharacterized membrane protein YsdA (DUF1294 family)